MPFPLLGLLIGAAAGAGKTAAVDAPAAARARKLQAATTFYSPWTGLKGQAPKEPDLFGNMLKFGTTGAMLHQNVGMDAGGGLSEGGAAKASNYSLMGDKMSEAPSYLGGEQLPQVSPYTLMKGSPDIAGMAYGREDQGEGSLLQYLQSRKRGMAGSMY